MDFTATDTAMLTGISVRSVKAISLKSRHRIAEVCEAGSPLQRAVEVDEYYFGARHVRANRCRSAYGKTIVYGLFKCSGKIYTEFVPDCS